MNQNQDLRMERDPGWSLARGIEHLPIANTRPLRVDVVLDFSEPEGVTPENREQAMLGGKLSQRVYFEYLREMLPMGTIISHLQPSHGCVRVSAIDVSRVHVILDRQDAMRIDWAKLEKELYSVDLDRVDVATMTQQRDRSKFAAEFLTQIATDPAGCGAGVEPVDHAVVLVSERQQYPRHTPVTPIQPEECPNCRFIYLRLTPYQFEPGDPYRDILKFLHPRSFQFYTPEGFRKVLQDLTAELSSPSSP